MKFIALEEAFAIPGIADPMSKLSSRTAAYAEAWLRKLPDFTEHRLPEMDDAGIEIQVLSLTVPGLQVDIDADSARRNARQANDYLAEVVSAHPTRFRGFAALPLQDPISAVAELHRCVTELGFCGALVNDHLGGHYLDEPLYEPVWEALESLGVPLYLHPGAPPAYLGTNIVFTTSGVFSRPRYWVPCWRWGPTPSCSPSTIPTSPRTRRSTAFCAPR